MTKNNFHIPEKAIVLLRSIKPSWWTLRRWAEIMWFRTSNFDSRDGNSWIEASAMDKDNTIYAK